MPDSPTFGEEEFSEVRYGAANATAIMGANDRDKLSGTVRGDSLFSLG